MKTGLLTDVALTEAEEIASRGFASPAVTIEPTRDFRVKATVTNTGGAAATYQLSVQAKGPISYLRMPTAFSLAKGASVNTQTDFLLTYFQLTEWEPGTYNIVVELLDSPTGKVLDTVTLPGELVISGAPAPTSKLTSVSAPASAAPGQEISIQVSWIAAVRAYISIMLLEPPGYTSYESYTSSVVFAPGTYTQTLKLTVQPANVTGTNRLWIVLVSEAGAYLDEQEKDISITGPTGVSGKLSSVSVAAL